MMRRTVMVMLGALALVAFTACGDDGPNAGDVLDAADGEFDIETPDGKVSVDGDDGEFKIEGEDGESSFSIGGGEIPDDFPDDIPLPDDYEVTSSVSSSGDSGFGGSVSLSTTDSYDDLVSMYEDALSSNGYSITNQSESTVNGSTTTSFSFEGNNTTFGSVIIGDDFLDDSEDTLGVNITYGEN